MERRRLLQGLLRLGTKELTQLSEWLESSSQRELGVVCGTLSDLYDKKLALGRRLKEGGVALAKWGLSPARGAPYQSLATETHPDIIPNYRIAKAGRREFLIAGGVVMAAVIGTTLYYVNPAFRALISGMPQENETAKTSVVTSRTSEFEETTTIRTYRMTTSTVWYYHAAHMGQGYEMHFKTARRGKVSEVRRALAEEGVAYFQDTVCGKFGRRIPRSKIRFGFEREEPATGVRNNIEMHARLLEYKRGHWICSPMPREALGYGKKT
jgi:hypothetical protein